MQTIEGIDFIVHEALLDQFDTFKIDFMSNFFKKSFVVSTGQGRPTC